MISKLSAKSALKISFSFHASLLFVLKLVLAIGFIFKLKNKAGC